MIDKKDVLFVGSFKDTAKDGSVGGQMYACKTILDSEISNKINWTLIDSTADGNVLSSIYKRSIKAIKRVTSFTKLVLRHKYHAIIIFTGDGLSFWEKGLMVLIAKSFSMKNVILAPRSGFIVRDLDSKKLISRYIPFVLKKADFVICQSSMWKSLFEKLIGREDEKFVVIENWINIESYINIPIRHSEAKIINILYLAWVDENKGIFDLLEAVKMLVSKGIKFKLQVAGNGASYDRAVSMVSEFKLEGFVSFVGWALGSKKIELLEEADIFVLPSYFEGYPNSLMEAMAASKACIATNVGSIPDMITDGNNGLLINPKRPKELCDAIEKLITDSSFRHKISIKARKRIVEGNTLTVAISKISLILNLK